MRNKLFTTMLLIISFYGIAPAAHAGSLLNDLINLNLTDSITYPFEYYFFAP